MNAIKGFADLFKRELDPETKNHHWASLISDGVLEVDSIITGLLSFAQPEKLQVETITGPEFLEGALATVRQRTPQGREVSDWSISSECHVESFRGDHIKLRRALRNLISNALEVQPEGGALLVCLFETETQVVFEVSDAGPGVSEEIASRMTDPFFTTRADGTGPGLSLVHTIVRLHGGSLEIDPSPSSLGGACIRFHIPKSPLR